MVCHRNVSCYIYSAIPVAHLFAIFDILTFISIYAVIVWVLPNDGITQLLFKESHLEIKSSSEPKKGGCGRAFLRESSTLVSALKL